MSVRGDRELRGAEVHPFVSRRTLDALDDFCDRLTRADGKKISRTDVAAWVLTQWAKEHPPERASEKAMRLAYRSRQVREAQAKEASA